MFVLRSRAHVARPRSFSHTPLGARLKCRNAQTFPRDGWPVRRALGRGGSTQGAKEESLAHPPAKRIRCCSPPRSVMPDRPPLPPPEAVNGIVGCIAARNVGCTDARGYWRLQGGPRGANFEEHRCTRSSTLRGFHSPWVGVLGGNALPMGGWGSNLVAASGSRHELFFSRRAT